MTDPSVIARAVELLRRGELVAFPTETVYGLGADASSPDAVRKIFAAKGRPSSHPLIVHLADAAQLSHWAVDLPHAARILAARYWPGPLTLIVKRAAHVPDAVTGGQQTVGLRVPAHPVARALLTAFGGGIAAPSANKFGRVSPTLAAHVRSEFSQAELALVLDGGPCDVGIESTIVDLSGKQPRLLRPGRISERELAELLGTSLGHLDADAPRAPGTLEQHYAPRTPTRLVATHDLEARVAATPNAAVLARQKGRAKAWITAPSEPNAYAHELYAALRELDGRGCDVILVEDVPAASEWDAVRDRLSRAAATTERTSS